MKKEQSRFGKIFEAPANGTEPNRNGPEAAGPGRPAGKHSDPSYGMFNFHLPRDLHYDFKLECLKHRVEMSVEVEGFIRERMAEWKKEETRM